jgi:hypothetical protein
VASPKQRGQACVRRESAERRDCLDDEGGLPRPPSALLDHDVIALTMRHSPSHPVWLQTQRARYAWSPMHASPAGHHEHSPCPRMEIGWVGRRTATGMRVDRYSLTCGRRCAARLCCAPATEPPLRHRKVGAATLPRSPRQLSSAEKASNGSLARGTSDPVMWPKLKKGQKASSSFQSVNAA